jgi:hypothetical protein
MDDSAAKAFAVEAVRKTAALLGVSVDAETAVQYAGLVVDALGKRAWKEAHERAVVEAQKLRTEAEAEAAARRRMEEK